MLAGELAPFCAELYNLFLTPYSSYPSCCLSSVQFIESPHFMDAATHVCVPVLSLHDELINPQCLLSPCKPSEKSVVFIPLSVLLISMSWSYNLCCNQMWLNASRWFHEKNANCNSCAFFIPLAVNTETSDSDPFQSPVINSAFQSHGDMFSLQQAFELAKYHFYAKFCSGPFILEEVIYMQLSSFSGIYLVMFLSLIN